MEPHPSTVAPSLRALGGGTATQSHSPACPTMLQGFAGNHPCNIPLGGMLEFTGTTVPNGDFVRSFGQAISRRNDDTGGLGGELWANGTKLGPSGTRADQPAPAGAAWSFS